MKIPNMLFDAMPNPNQSPFIDCFALGRLARGSREAMCFVICKHGKAEQLPESHSIRRLSFSDKGTLDVAYFHPAKDNAASQYQAAIV